MVFGGGDHRLVPALDQRAGNGNVGVEITQGAGSGEKKAAQPAVPVPAAPERARGPTSSMGGHSCGIQPSIDDEHRRDDNDHGRELKARVH
jgi:hypothetical protein